MCLQPKKCMADDPACTYSIFMNINLLLAHCANQLTLITKDYKLNVN